MAPSSAVMATKARALVTQKSFLMLQFELEMKVRKNQGEGPYKGLLLESANYRFNKHLRIY